MPVNKSNSDSFSLEELNAMYDNAMNEGSLPSNTGTTTSSGEALAKILQEAQNNSNKGK
jgi:hypothetical protein